MTPWAVSPEVAAAGKRGYPVIKYMEERTGRPVFVDPSFPFAVRRVISARPSHFRHERLIQLLCLVKGRTSFGTDRVVILPPGHGSSFKASPGSEIIQALFSPSFLDNTFVMREALILSPTESVYSEIQKAMLTLLEEFEDQKPEYRSMIRLKLQEVLLILYRTGKAVQNTPPIRGGPGIAEIKHYIDDNYEENFTLPAMARRCGLNTSYFSRAFREEVGMPPFEYINRIRVQKSCLLLKRTDMTILEIALSVGYNNVSFFNRYFRKIMKMSPREYRNLIQK
jgi:AraC-like DNA-binding protein